MIFTGMFLQSGKHVLNGQWSLKPNALLSDNLKETNKLALGGCIKYTCALYDISCVVGHCGSVVVCAMYKREVTGLITGCTEYAPTLCS